MIITIIIISIFFFIFSISIISIIIIIIIVMFFFFMFILILIHFLSPLSLSPQYSTTYVCINLYAYKQYMHIHAHVCVCAYYHWVGLLRLFEATNNRCARLFVRVCVSVLIDAPNRPLYAGEGNVSEGAPTNRTLPKSSLLRQKHASLNPHTKS